MKITLVVSIALSVAVTLPLRAQGKQWNKDAAGTDLLDHGTAPSTQRGAYGSNYGGGTPTPTTDPIGFYLALQAASVADNAADDDSGLGYNGPWPVTGSTFPNANEEGCAIPLLLSCSPTVVLGELAHPHFKGYSPTYKPSDEPQTRVVIMEDSIHVNDKMAGWHDAGRTAGNYVEHYAVSQDPRPHPHPGYVEHHKVSVDFPQPNLVVYQDTHNHTVV